MKRYTTLFFMVFISSVILHAQETSNNDSTVTDMRPYSLAFSTGFKSIVGTGFILGTVIDRNHSLEFGAGLSTNGTKYSFKYRYFFKESEITPYLGLGIGIADDNVSTSKSKYYENIDMETGKTIKYEILPTPSAQLIAGINMTTYGGFYMNAGFGYNKMLMRNNLDYVTSVSRPMDIYLNIMHGNSISLEISVGYAFEKKEKRMQEY